MTKISIIIPSYNEADTLAKIIERVNAADLGPVSKEIIVVDDGSSDHTLKTAETFSSDIRFLRHPQNRGKSAAIRTGLAEASGEYVVIQDADLEYNPNDLRILIEKAISEGLPAVYGSRNYHAPFWKSGIGRIDYLLGGIVVTLFTNLLFNQRLTDEPTCYKLVNRSIMNSLSLSEERFGFCPEVTAKLYRLGHTIVELPISYSPRSITEGKKIRYKDGLHALYILTKYRFKDTKNWHREPESGE